MRIRSYRVFLCFVSCLLIAPILYPFSMLAAPSNFSRDLDGYASAKSPAKKTKKRTTKPAPAPIVVKDIRVVSHPDYTRLVLDLQRNVTFTQNRLKKPDRLVIRLHNSLLSKAALAKLSDADFPNDVVITQTNHTAPYSVTISLDLGAISDYKLLPLNRPSRLVVDLFNQASEQESGASSPVAQ
ncbi:MAG: hypothetical protein C4294_14620, partial [Nitrospiraceae bacterium]